MVSSSDCLKFACDRQMVHPVTSVFFWSAKLFQKTTSQALVLNRLCHDPLKAPCSMFKVSPIWCMMEASFSHPSWAGKHFQATSFCSVNHLLIPPPCVAEMNIQSIYIDKETIIKVNSKCWEQGNEMPDSSSGTVLRASKTSSLITLMKIACYRTTRLGSLPETVKYEATSSPILLISASSH